MHIQLISTDTHVRTDIRTYTHAYTNNRTKAEHQQTRVLRIPSYARNPVHSNTCVMIH